MQRLRGKHIKHSRLLYRRCAPAGGDCSQGSVVTTPSRAARRYHAGPHPAPWPSAAAGRAPTGAAAHPGAGSPDARRCCAQGSAGPPRPSSFCYRRRRLPDTPHRETPPRAAGSPAGLGPAAPGRPPPPAPRSHLSPEGPPRHLALSIPSPAVAMGPPPPPPRPAPAPPLPLATELGAEPPRHWPEAQHTPPAHWPRLRQWGRGEPRAGAVRARGRRAGPQLTAPAARRPSPPLPARRRWGSARLPGD